MPRATEPIALPERYRLVGHVASGGMATVWEAHDELLGRTVAVKQLAGHLSQDVRARRRFEREARAAAGLSSHPHVVTIYDVADQDGAALIVMEHFRGGTVADRLRSGDPIPRRVALRWLREAASALDAAHEAGIVHRDVKPANMLLDQRGRLALGDFGIARLALEDHLTQTGQVLGTSSYLSPEQALGEPATEASDRYALALVAFELLTGRRPFIADHAAAQARAHVEDEPPAASALAPGLPRAVDAVLARGLAKDPADRWPTAGAFVSALADALDDARATRPLAAAARPPATAAAPPPARTSPPRPPAAPVRRRSRVLAVLALAALALVGGVAAALLTGGGGGGDDGGTAADRERPRATATAEATRTAKPKAKAKRTATAEPAATATATATATAAPTAAPTTAPAPAAGGDASALQLQAFSHNRAGRYDQALRASRQAVQLCEGSTQVSPCAYALYEYAVALRHTGDPRRAVAVLEERQRRFPDDQPAAVEEELARARAAVGGS